MKRRLAFFQHKERKLYYVGIYNTDRATYSSSIETNYGRARYFYNKLLEGKSPSALKSGFYLALVNTDFSGWDGELLDGEYDVEDAKAYKRDLILDFQEDATDWTYVGSDRVYARSDNPIASNSDWSKKWNIKSLTREKIYEKVEFISRAIDIDIPQTIYNEAYMCAVIPDGVKTRHGWNYEINDLVTLFRFVRNYIGKDVNAKQTA